MQDTATENNGRLTMDDAMATIKADHDTRLQEFGEKLAELQNLYGVRLEIHQYIVPVINQDRR